MSYYFICIIAFLVGTWLLEAVCTLLNIKSLNSGLPEEFRDVIDEKQYKNSLRYTIANAQFSLVSETFSTILVLFCLLFGIFDLIDKWAFSLTSHAILQGLFFFGVLAFASSLTSLPFSLYHTFILEEQFGFNRTTVKTFVTDRIKGAVLGICIGAPLLAGILWFFLSMGEWAWLFAWGFLVCVLLIIQYLAPVYIMPLFNTFTPLEEGELRSRIEAYIARQGFSLSGLFVMDGSKRSGKANAFFTGFGAKRRIALFDTLIQSMSVDEILGVVAHEVGHCKKRHITRMLFSGIIKTGLLFFLLSCVIRNNELFLQLEMHRTTLHVGMLLFSLLYTPVSLLYGIWANSRSRTFEYEADAFAAATTGKPEALIRALKGLSRDNLSNLTPHPFTVIMHYSHPPVLQRITALRKGKE